LNTPSLNLQSEIYNLQWAPSLHYGLTYVSFKVHPKEEPPCRLGETACLLIRRAPLSPRFGSSRTALPVIPQN